MENSYPIATEVARYSICGRELKDYSDATAEENTESSDGNVLEEGEKKRILVPSGMGVPKRKEVFYEEAVGIFHDMVREEQVMVDHDAVSEAMGGEASIPGHQNVKASGKANRKTTKRSR